MNRRRIVSAAAASAALLVAPPPAQAAEADYHHVHLTTSNATEAINWYTRYLDCEPLADRDDSVDCAGAQVVFESRPTLGSSQRTGIDHISFSYPDLDAKMGELESIGVRGSGVRLQRFEMDRPLRDEPGLFKHGFIFDPWGTRIELVEDADTLGFHHVHLSATDPAATLEWYLENFGGERARLRDSLDGLRVGDIWLLAMPHEGEAPAATAGRAIDHIAFAVDDIDSAAGDLRQRGRRVSRGAGGARGCPHVRHAGGLSAAGQCQSGGRGGGIRRRRERDGRGDRHHDRAPRLHRAAHAVGHAGLSGGLDR